MCILVCIYRHIEYKESDPWVDLETGTHTAPEIDREMISQMGILGRGGEI